LSAIKIKELLLIFYYFNQICPYDFYKLFFVLN